MSSNDLDYPSGVSAKGDRGVPYKMYVSRALSAWGDRMWDFGGGLFMMSLMGEDLRLVAIYGFAKSLSVIIFGAAIGNWIDKNQRLTSAKFFLALQNLLVCLDCLLLAAFFWKRDWFEENLGGATTAVTVISAIVIFVATIANLASVGSKIVLEKDWIVVIAMDDQERLAKMNAVFRTVDLTTLILAPVIGGLLFDFVGDAFAAVFIAGWNLVSVVVEYTLLILIYREFPGLARKDHLDIQNDTKDTVLQKVKRSVNSWVMFWNHPIFFSGIALASLYMTVLGFDNITYGYALQQCIRESVLGGLVALSAVFGIAGSLTFPLLRKRLNVTRAGLLGFTTLLLTLIPTTLSIFLPGSPFQLAPNGGNSTHVPPPGVDVGDEECYVCSRVSITTLLVGMIAARFGLWISDLSITQILQEGVEEQYRGTVGGVQNSLNSIMDTVKFLLVIILPGEDTFGYLVLASVSSMLLGASFYSLYAAKNWHGTKLPGGNETKALKGGSTKSNNSATSYGGTDDTPKSSSQSP